METETNQEYSSVDEATVIIDNALNDMMKRDLMASADMRDLLLDLRNILNK